MINTIRTERLFYDFLINSNISEFYSQILNLLFFSLIVFLSIIIINFFSKKVILKLFKGLSRNTKTNFDDFLVQNNTPIYVSKLVPVFFIYWVIPFWFYDFEPVIDYVFLGLEIYIVLTLVWIIRSFLRSVTI